MRRMVEKIMRCHGQRLTVVCGGVEQEVVGFLQPITGNAQHMARITAQALGTERYGQFVYLGPAEHRLEADDLVRDQGKEYLVRTAQVISKGGQELYCWAMCTEKGRDVPWEISG